MSHNTGASGTIVLPKALYTTLVKEFIAEYIRLMTIDVKTYNTFLESTLLKYKGKKNLQWRTILVDEGYDHFIYNPNGNYNKNSPFHTIDYVSFAHMVAGFGESTQKPRAIKITKSNVSPSKTELKASAPTVELPFEGENNISFNKEHHSISLYISFNNHSLEEGLKNTFYKFFLQKMKAIEWIRNSGGVIYSQYEDTNSDFPNTNEHIMLEFKPATKSKTTIK